MIRMPECEALQGSLVLKVFRDERLYRIERMKNLIVLKGRHNLAKMLGGETGLHITQIGIGEGKGEPASANTELTSPLFFNVTESRIGTGLLTEDGDIFDDYRMAQFHFRIGRSAAVGKSIWEYGLFCANGDLFSRRVRNSEFVKDNTDLIEGYWEIQF